MKDTLSKINTPHEIIQWVGNRTIDEIWRECPNGTWLDWIVYTLKEYIDTTEVFDEYIEYIDKTTCLYKVYEHYQQKPEYANKLREVCPEPPNYVKKFFKEMS